MFFPILYLKRKLFLVFKKILTDLSSSKHFPGLWLLPKHSSWCYIRSQIPLMHPVPACSLFKYFWQLSMPSSCSPGISRFPSDLRPFSNTETHQESSTRNCRTNGMQLHLRIKQQCQQQKSATVQVETLLCHGLAEKWKL